MKIARGIDEGDLQLLWFRLTLFEGLLAKARIISSKNDSSAGTDGRVLRCLKVLAFIKIGRVIVRTESFE